MITVSTTAPQTPSRRALASVALVSVLSMIEKQRRKEGQSEGLRLKVEDMSGELQTIPARHGVATFVPRDRTIKVINTYGKQVVSMWAFTLGVPPKEGEDEEEEEAVKKGEEEEEQMTEKEEVGPKSEKEEHVDENEAKGKKNRDTDAKTEHSKNGTEESFEHVRSSPEAKTSSQNTAAQSAQASKRTWSSYLPSIPYRNKGATNKPDTEQRPSAAEEKVQNAENTKRWSSYLPTGKGFSSYVPNVQLPDSKGVVSAFRSSHHRDPNKSYAEQLYDFSKTPVGAGTIAAATGSGYASSVYAAYSAYTSTDLFHSSQPPVEYLSLPHTRASSYKLIPSVNDQLFSNLRNPILTLIEDTTPGDHDTLTAACDANLYATLGVERPEEHGSCAENLVIALKELNESVGLKGARAIGSNISVNIAPTPLHLFMSAPISQSSSSTDQGGEGAGTGTKGAIIKVEEAKGKKRSYIRFRAERDVVIVFSACPMELGPMNGGRCMAANFMVEHVQEDEHGAASIDGVGKKKPKKLVRTRSGKVVDSSKGKVENESGIDAAKEQKEEPKEQQDGVHNKTTDQGKKEDKAPEMKHDTAPSVPRRDSAKTPPTEAEKQDTQDKKPPAARTGRRESGAQKSAPNKPQKQDAQYDRLNLPSRRISDVKQSTPMKPARRESQQQQTKMEEGKGEAQVKRKPKKLQVRSASVAKGS